MKIERLSGWLKRFLPVVVSLLLFEPVQGSHTVVDERAAAFQSAKPVWPEGREKERNLMVGFRAKFTTPAGERVVLRAAGASLYRIFLNGKFLGHGPARGPHGYYRLDEIDLTDRLKAGMNEVAFEVAGYNINSFYLLDQPSFLEAEVMAGDKVLAATASEANPFEACILRERVQKVQRYSFQRTFSEVYRLIPGGELKTGIHPPKVWKDRSLTAIGPKLGGFPEKELETIPSLELQTVANATSTPLNQPWVATTTLSLIANQYRIVDFGADLSGFIGARIHCKSKARVFFAFDEILSNGDVDFKRLSCVNLIGYELAPGLHEVESFEPYTMKYLKIIVLEGECEVSGLYLREYTTPIPAAATFSSGDERLNKIYAAGRESCRQNVVDVFMDCPSRERAGWLCDSYFTSRVIADLQGNTKVEKSLFEAFLLPEKFANLPEGMLPMCYPAEALQKQFIPNWAMFFIVQLDEAARLRHLPKARQPLVKRSVRGLLPSSSGW